VPESVLTKPGKLTKEEFDIIKTHPRIGGRILQDIRQMQDLLPGVLYHHERFDGRGYPDGLSGEAIPLFGRVICLADSFDAMTSNRTYRQALPLDKVLEEIRDCSGTQFDPHLADVFVTLDFTPFQQMLENHRGRTSPLRQELETRPS
jgi:putative two-component system response regulator